MFWTGQMRTPIRYGRGIMVCSIGLREIGQREVTHKLSTSGGYRVSIFDVLNEIPSFPPPLQHFILQASNVLRVCEIFLRVGG